MRIQHQLLALMVAFIWGSNFILIKIGLVDLPPFLFVFLRFSLVVLPLIFFFPKPKVSWGTIASYGILIGFGQFGLLFWAMQAEISPGLASLVVQSQVFFTLILARTLLAEAILPWQWLGLLLCAAGLLLIASMSAMSIGSETGHATTVLGLAVVLLCWRRSAGLRVI